MVQKSPKRRLILLAALLVAGLPLSAQRSSGQTDSLVRLLNARYLEQVETEGKMARKAIEPTFLHNGTYLSCDTALWHVEEKLINCFGHVQLLQGESVLTSEKLQSAREPNPMMTDIPDVTMDSPAHMIDSLRASRWGLSFILSSR